VDFTPGQVVTVASGVSAVATISLKIAWDAVRRRKVKNGHAEPERAIVQPRDALWFAQSHSKEIRLLNRIAKRLGVEQEKESDLE
jgi:hypothetical protein